MLSEIPTTSPMRGIAHAAGKRTSLRSSTANALANCVRRMLRAARRLRTASWLSGAAAALFAAEPARARVVCAFARKEPARRREGKIAPIAFTTPASLHFFFAAHPARNNAPPALDYFEEGNGWPG
jgi:hypothetical protein